MDANAANGSPHTGNQSNIHQDVGGADHIPGRRANGTCPLYTPFEEASSGTTYPTPESQVPPRSQRDHLTMEQWLREERLESEKMQAQLQPMIDSVRRVQEICDILDRSLKDLRRQSPCFNSPESLCHRGFFPRQSWCEIMSLDGPSQPALSRLFRKRKEALRFAGYVLVDEARLIAGDIKRWRRETKGAGEAADLEKRTETTAPAVRTLGQFFSDERRMLRGDYYEWRRFWHQGKELAREDKAAKKAAKKAEKAAKKAEKEAKKAAKEEMRMAAMRAETARQRQTCRGAPARRAQDDFLPMFLATSMILALC